MNPTRSNGPDPVWANWTTVAQRCIVLSRFRGECEALTSQVRHGKQEITTDQASIPIPALLIPAPRAVVVSGHLDEIGHGLRRFRLLMGGYSLQGRLGRGNLDVELLRPLWGKRATVQGIVHFKSNGQPHFIEARRISTRAEGDKIFETMPVAEIGGGRVADVLMGSDRPGSVSRGSAKAIHRVDPMVLWGAWPGDEPIEELLAQLD